MHPGGPNYVETISVVVDQRAMQASLQQTERNYRNTMNRLNQMRDIQMRATMTGNALQQMQQLRTQAQQLSRQTINMRVNMAGNVANQLRNVQRQAARAITMPVNVVSHAAGAVGQVAAPIVEAASVAGLGEATKQSIDYSDALMKVRNNTTMDAAETATLGRNVNEISQKYGLATTQLFNGARQIQDYTQNATAMNAILQVSSEAAASTGADVGETSSILASAMHQYKADVGDLGTVTQNAARYMGVLHYAAAEGNMTLQQFSDNTGRAIALAAQLGVPIEQVAAAESALTRNGYDAAQAQTQVMNIFTHMIRPGAAAQKTIDAISRKTGVDLHNAFSATGVQQYGLTGVFDMTTQAYQKLGLTQAQATEATLNLLQAQRGGIGAALLMGKGADDYKQILGDLTNQQKVSTFVSDSWARSQDNPATQLRQFEQRVAAASRAIGSLLVPWLMLGLNWLEAWFPWVISVAIVLSRQLQPAFDAVKNAIATLWGWGIVALGWIQTFLSWVLLGINWLREHQLAMAALVGVFAGLAVGAMVAYAQLVLWPAILGAIGAAMAILDVIMSPWILIPAIIVAIGAALIYVYTHSETFRNIVNGAFNAVMGVVNLVVNFVNTKLGGFGNVLLMLLGPIGFFAIAWQNNFMGIQQIVENVINSIVGAIGGLMDWLASNNMLGVQKNWREGWNQMKGDAVNAVQGTAAAVGGTINQINTEMQQSTGSTAPLQMPSIGVDQGAVAAQQKQIQDMMNRLASGEQMSSQQQMAAMGIGGAPQQQQIDEALARIGSGIGGSTANPLDPAAIARQSQAAGAAVPQGMTQGMQDAMPGLTDAQRQALKDYIGMTREQLGASSPSRVFAGIGSDMIDGLVAGIRGGDTRVAGALGDLVTLVQDTVHSQMSQGVGGTANLGANERQWAQTQQGPLIDAARAAAKEFNIDPDVFLRQIHQESGFNPNALSPAGARGIAQFMPGTGAGMATQMGVTEGQFWADPTLQLRGAAKLMSQNLGMFGGDYAKALAAYNAGAGNVQKYGGVPPFAETQSYVKNILGMQGGGVLNEPVLGMGTSGRMYSFAEDRPEYVGHPGAAGARPIAASHTFHAPITVHAAPGQSPEEIGVAVRQELQRAAPKMWGDFANHFVESLGAIPEGVMG